MINFYNLNFFNLFQINQMVVRMRLGKIVGDLKVKIKTSLRMRKRSSLSSSSSSSSTSSSSSYEKIEKSDSMRFELRSRKAHKIIQQTLQIADSPTSRTYALWFHLLTIRNIFIHTYEFAYVSVYTYLKYCTCMYGWKVIYGWCNVMDLILANGWLLGEFNINDH